MIDCCILLAADGGVYEGEFQASMRHGNGMMIFPDGTQYRELAVFPFYAFLFSKSWLRYMLDGSLES